MAIEKVHVSAIPKDDAWMPSLWTAVWIFAGYWAVGFFAGIAAMAVYYSPIYLFFDVFGVSSDRTQMSNWRWSCYTETLKVIYAYPAIALSITCILPGLWGMLVTHPFDQAVKSKESGLLGKIYRGVTVDADIVQPTEESRPTLIRALQAIRFGFLPMAYMLSWTWGVWKFNKGIAIIATVAVTIVAFGFDFWLLKLIALKFWFALVVVGQIGYWCQWLADHRALAAGAKQAQDPSDGPIDEIQYRR